MKLLDAKHHQIIHFSENKVQVLVLERADIFVDFLQRFYGQCQGQDENFILSENEHTLSLEKEVEFVLNPVGISFQNKRISVSLLREMGQAIDNVLMQDALILKNQILKFVNELCDMMPYDLECVLDLNLMDIVKAANVRIETDGKTLCERLIQYVKIHSLLCRTKLLVFVNLKMYLSENEIFALYETAFYYKIYLLLVESVQRNRLEGEQYHIIDADFCEINF